jgi:hypothetical protein
MSADESKAPACPFCSGMAKQEKARDGKRHCAHCGNAYYSAATLAKIHDREKSKRERRK